MCKTETPGRLEQQTLRLSELATDIEYQKSSLSTRSDVRSRLMFLENSTMPVHEDISAKPCDAMVDREQAELESDVDVSDYLLLTHDNNQNPLFVPIW